MSARSPLIVQISQTELERYQLSPAEFAQAFWEQLAEEQPDVPIGLHLDHTKRFEVIQAAIDSGFTSVMIDASAHDLQENIAISRRVVEMAHPHHVSVEAELGRIGTTDQIETENDVELYTRPEDAEQFVRETGVDALAVSVGTAHGVYRVRQPKVDLQRLSAIRARTSVPLVLHGGSGVPAEMVAAAIHLPGGGVSKVNLATDLELALLQALGRERMTSAALAGLPPSELEKGLLAVQQVVEDKMKHFLGSAGKA